MIAINFADISFDLMTILNKEVIIENVFLEAPNVHLIKNTSDGLLNFNEFIKAINKRFKKKKKKKLDVEFRISAIQINNGLMSYNDQRKDSLTNIFDYYHFELQKINLQASGLFFKDNITSFDVRNLNLYEPTYKMTAHNLDATTRIGLDFIELSSLEAKIGKSIIKDFIRFDFESFKAFEDFNRLVTIKASLDKSIITSGDIGMFSTTVRNNMDEIWTVSGDYTGEIKNFRSNNFEIGFGKNSIAKGKLNFDGLPDFYNTFLDIKLDNSHIKASDLSQYFPSKTAKNNLTKFGHIIANGSFIGYPLDFVAFGDFSTSIGNVTSDINLKITDGKERAYYKGKLSTHNFDLGKLTKLEDYFDKINMKGEIEGKGLTLESADFKLKADITKLDLLDYSYSDIHTDGEFSNKKFDGDINIADTNLNFVASGIIDFSREKPLIQVKSTLNKANLKPLNLTDKESLISTKLDVNISGISIDKAIGIAKFDDLKISYDSNYLNLTSITLFSSLKNQARRFTIISPYLNYNMEGNYTYSKLTKDVVDLREELLMGLRNNQQEIDSYYSSKKEDTSKYKIEYSLNILDLNPLLNLYNIDADISKNTVVEGDFKQGNNTIFTSNASINHFRYKDYELFKTVLDINSSKFNTTADVLAYVILESEQQKVSGFSTEKLHAEAIWSENKLELESFVKQKDESNKASLRSTINFEQDTTYIKLNEFKILAYDQTWEMADSNSAKISKDYYEFKNLIFGHKEQLISINGIFSKDPTHKGEVNLQEFNIDLLNPFSPQPLSGITNLKLHITDAFKTQKILGNYTIDNLSIANNVLGNVDGIVQWNKNQEDVYVSLDLLNENEKIVEVSGLIFPFKGKNNLNLNATINPIDLDLIQPYLKAYASEFKGKFNGDVAIKGDFDYPILEGDINLENTSFKYDYTQTTYYVNDKLSLRKDKIIFDDVIIFDAFDNKGIVKGKLTHKAFKEYANDIKLSFNNLKLLNTKAEDNTLYYGTVYGTGHIDITGPINDVTIKADAKTERNSEIFIPLNGFEGVEDKEFIRFTSFDKSKIKKDTNSTIDLSGINMDFNFEITEDAYMEIIFDSKAGDIIRGNGTGDLNLVIDTRGDFNVFGDYIINKGAYNFTLLNIVNKEFNVVPGGVVSWNGDPYQGELNVEAKYKQRASLGPIVLDTAIWISNPSFKSKKYPTDVILSLNGDLLHPQIGLDIDIQKEGLGVMQTEVNSFETEIKNNEQELNRQVFSLIILKQFARRNTSGLNLGASAGRSMSELISNQLSYWMSQVDDKLEIDLDIGSLSAADNSSYQLRLSYSLLDGRLRLSNQTDYDKNTDLSTVTGEWTLEYLITKDGKLKLKMYNRTSQNSYSNNIENSTYSTAGSSIQYTKGFGSIKELFLKKDNKEKK